MLAIIIVLHLHVNESFSTSVSLLPRKGRWTCSWSIALMHSFNANNDLFISELSCLVSLSWSRESEALSLPAKSIKEILPTNLEAESLI